MPWRDIIGFTNFGDKRINDLGLLQGYVLGRTTSWSPKSQCVYGPENEIAAVTFFAKNGAALTKQYSCKCNGMAGFRGTPLLIEGL